MVEPSKRQLGLFPATGDNAPAPAQPPQGAPGHEAQLAEVVRTEVPHLVFFQLSPQVLDRVQFGSVSGQPFLLDASLPGQVVLHQPAAMSRQAVPQQNQLPLQMPPQVGQEFQHLRRLDRPLVQLKVEIDEGHARNHRQGLPVEVILQDRGLASRSPSAYPMGTFAQPAFIQQYDRGPQLPGFFLMRGHCTRFQCRIRASLRSFARPTGRWQLQPIWASTRPTWSRWYRTPKRRWIRSATRLVVHSSVVYPQARGPRTSSSSKRRSWSAVILAGRPARPAFFRPASPSRSSCCCQRPTDWRCTPRRRPISAGLRPPLSKRAGLNLRRSPAEETRFPAVLVSMSTG